MWVSLALAVPPIRANTLPASETGGFIMTALSKDPGPPPLLLAGRRTASRPIG